MKTTTLCLLCISFITLCHAGWWGRRRTTYVYQNKTVITCVRILTKEGGTVNIHGETITSRSFNANDDNDIIPKCTRECDTTLEGDQLCTFVCSKVCMAKFHENLDLRPKPIPRQFNLFDIDGDGRVSMEELSQGASVPIVCTIEPFQMADENGDDEIDQYEFEAAPWNFEEHDINARMIANNSSILDAGRKKRGKRAM